MILTDLSDKEISEYSMKIWEKSVDIEIDKGIVISPLLRNILVICETLKVLQILDFFYYIYVIFLLFLI